MKPLKRIRESQDDSHDAPVLDTRHSVYYDVYELNQKIYERLTSDTVNHLNHMLQKQHSIGNVLENSFMSSSTYFLNQDFHPRCQPSLPKTLSLSGPLLRYYGDKANEACHSDFSPTHEQLLPTEDNNTSEFTVPPVTEKRTILHFWADYVQ